MGALHLRKSRIEQFNLFFIFGSFSPKDISATASLILFQDSSVQIKNISVYIKKINFRELFTVQAKSSHDAFG